MIPEQRVEHKISDSRGTEPASASRRDVLRGGLAALAVGLARVPLARAFQSTGELAPLPQVLPIRAGGATPTVPRYSPSIRVDGLPFYPRWTGDFFDNEQMPFHTPENQFPFDKPPDPTERVDIAIVGGGLSGLTTAYLLRHRNPVVFDLQPRFGGTSQGETWARIRYSLGAAYFIVPDEGSELEAFYRELGLDRAYRLSQGADPVELNGRIVDDPWSDPNLPPAERSAIEVYRAAVAHFAENYPDIPLDPEADNAWILALDEISFQQDIEQRLGGPIPPLLYAAIQAYFFSSFGTGAERISAACGWNFVAAEEYGRWVMPGGNSYVIDALWQRLIAEEAARPGPAPRLRLSARVVDVRPAPGGDVQVTWRDAARKLHSLIARRVVMACPKHVAKHVLHEIDRWDALKAMAFDRVHTSAYVVANVLLDAPIRREFYDMFALGGGTLPDSETFGGSQSRVVDVVRGDYNPRVATPRSVLTLYWPQTSVGGRRVFMGEGDWQDFARRLAPQIRGLMDVFGIPARRIWQIRMSRWGHALPVAEPGFLGRGDPEHLRRPLSDSVYFVNQDNWALPAFETCVLEAMHFAPRIEAGL